MDNIILGLLLLSGRTIYQLRDRINKGMNLMFSSSMGSIQAAIKKLLASGCIDFTEVVENGKYKKVYHITDTGRTVFLQWVNAPMEDAGMKFPNLAKVYFMGFAQQENRERSILQQLEYLKQQHALLESICSEGCTMQVPAEAANILKYQLQSAMYGRDLIKFNIDWFENLLNQIRSEAK